MGAVAETRDERQAAAFPAYADFVVRELARGKLRVEAGVVNGLGGLVVESAVLREEVRIAGVELEARNAVLRGEVLKGFDIKCGRLGLGQVVDGADATPPANNGGVLGARRLAVGQIVEAIVNRMVPEALVFTAPPRLFVTPFAKVGRIC